MTPFVKLIDGFSYMAIPDGDFFRLHNGSTIPTLRAILDHEAMEEYETLKNKIPQVVAYLEDKKVSVFQNPDKTYSAWIKGAEVGKSPNPVLALLVAAVMALEHEKFEGWAGDLECVDCMNSLDEAVIKGYHSEVWVDRNNLRYGRNHYYCLVDGEIRSWDNNPFIALIEGLAAFRLRPENCGP